MQGEEEAGVDAGKIVLLLKRSKIRKAPARRCLSSGHLRTRPPDSFPPTCAVFWVHCLDSVCLGFDGSFREIVPREPERTRGDCVIIDSGNDETVAINFRSRRRLRLTKETGQRPRPTSLSPILPTTLLYHRFELRVLIRRFPM